MIHVRSVGHEQDLQRAPAARRFLVAGALALVALLDACAGAQGPGGIPGTVIDTTWYVSARARDNGRDTRRRADSLEFGVVLTSRRTSGDPTTDDLEIEVVDSLRLSREDFAASLRARALLPDARSGPVVLHVHGFGTSLREAWLQGAEGSARARSRAPWVVFSWPSNGTGIARPQQGELFYQAYRDDAASAVASQGAFVEAASVVLDVVGAERLIVVSHSMGVRVVGEVLASDSMLRRLLQPARLRAVAFFAPDVEVDRFADSLLPPIREVAQRVVLYASSNDRVLAFSRSLNRTERAGLLPEDGTTIAREGLESIDLTAGVNAEGRVRRVLGAHHAMRRASAALFDLVHLVGGGAPARCRETLGTARRLANGSWRLTRQQVPPPAAIHACLAS